MEFFRPPPNRAARRDQARSRRAGRAPKPDRRAPRSRRLAAAAIDWTAGTLVFWTVLVVAALAGARPFEPRTLFVHVAVTAAVVELYIIDATARRGQTLGKRLTGIRIVRSDTFDLPGWRRAAIRTLALIPLAGLPAGGIAAQAARATALADPPHQGFHDIVAGTVVVDDRSWSPWYAGKRGARSRSCSRSPEPRLDWLGGHRGLRGGAGVGPERDRAPRRGAAHRGPDRGDLVVG